MPKVIARYENKSLGASLQVLDDVSYEIVKGDYVQRFDMTKWYRHGGSVIRHIDNDIEKGYRAGYVKVEG
jgi:hypothetical protein